ncbi:MAG: PhnD/SsuA/transferrin family substrate-binding protein [Anaerolineales bacterium]
MLRFTNCQAPNAEAHFGAIAAYLARKLGIEHEHVQVPDWRAREAALFRGEVQVGWVCGLPYVLEADRPGSSIELLAAPVMADSRYEGKPVYFSDVVVRAQEPVGDFLDLRDKRWAFNEPHSHSGYNITRYMLASKGLDGSFFAQRVEAGSHERALRLLLRGRIDATALDSTVLETELKNDPRLGEQVRIIEAWGPSPIPPWVVHRSLSVELQSRLRGALVNMHADPEGAALLASGRMKQFVAVADRDYDAIRGMYNKGKTIQFLEI